MFFLKVDKLNEYGKLFFLVEGYNLKGQTVCCAIFVWPNNYIFTT